MRRSLYGMLGLLAACGDDAATGKAALDAAALRPDAAIVAPREDAWTAPVDAGVVPVDGPGDGRDAAVPGMDAAPVVPDAAAPGADATPATPDAASPAVDAALVGPDAAPPVADAAPPALDAAAPAPAQTASACFERVFGRAIDLGPNYDQFAPTIADHCQGTNHQAIAGVQRVVFVGDSVTVGTPPTQPRDFYRTRLANSLAQRFGLQAPDAIWQNVNLIDGGALSQESGDFASCAKFGARTDDLRRDNDQLERCLPEAERDKTTLIVMTMGGNDVASVTQDGLEGRAVDELWGETMEFVDLLRDALEWIRTPGRFPNGVFVVFANLYEFTDGPTSSICASRSRPRPTWSSCSRASAATASAETTPRAPATAAPGPRRGSTSPASTPAPRAIARSPTCSRPWSRSERCPISVDPSQFDSRSSARLSPSSFKSVVSCVATSGPSSMGCSR